MLQSHTKINQYIITKLLKTGDYLARDQFQNQYLLSPVSSLQTKFINSDITFENQSTQLLNLQQIISSNQQSLTNLTNNYACFKIPIKCMWIGQLCSIKLKSQLYCISLIYNAVNHIVKPLIQNFGYRSLHYLSVANMWIRNHQIFLALRPRQVNHQTNTNITDQNLEKKVLRQFATIMHQLIYHSQPHQSNQSSLLFLSIFLRSMVREEITLFQFDQLMDDKSARLKFQNQVKSSFNFHIIQSKTNHSNRRYLLQKSKKAHYHPQQPKSNEKYRKIKSKFPILPPSFQRPPRKSYDLSTIANKSINLHKKKNLSISITQDFENVNNQNNDIKVKNTLKFKGKTDFITIKSNQQGKPNFRGESVRIKFRGESVRISSLIDGQRERALRKFGEFLKPKQKSVDQKTFKDTIINKSRTLTIDNFTKNASLQQNNSNYHTIQVQQLGETNIQSMQLKIYNNTGQKKGKQKIVQKIENFLNLSEYKNNNSEYVHTQFQNKQKIENNYNKSAQKQQNNIKNTNNDSIKSLKDKIINNNNLKQQITVQKSQFLSQTQQFDFVNLPQVQIKGRGINKKKQVNQTIQKQIISIQKKQQTKIIQSHSKPLPKLIKEGVNQYDDQIQQIKLVPKKQSTNVKLKKEQQKMVKIQEKITSQKSLPPQYPPKNKQVEDDYYEKKQERQKSNKKKAQLGNSQNQAKKRVNTNQSSAGSSYGPTKSVRKQIQQYIALINKMGQAVSKTSKLAKKLEDIQWYIGIYFIYKRFYYERKRIEKWVEKGEPNLTRYGNMNIQEWNEWLGKQQRQQLLKKIKDDNASIQQSIQKMNKKISKKNLPGRILFHTNLERQSFQQSKIAIQYAVDEFDQLVEKKKLNDEQILIHISEIINCLFIIGQLDGKIKQKKPVAQFSVKLSQKKLKQICNKIYAIYQL